MHTLRPFAAAFILCGAIVVAASARQEPAKEPLAAVPSPSSAPDARSPRNANYEIDARLDDDAKSIRGRETIRWRNITDQGTSELQFHLYWNAWRDQESTWFRERRMAGLFRPPPTDAWSSMDVTALRLRDAVALRVIDAQRREQGVARRLPVAAAVRVLLGRRRQAHCCPLNFPGAPFRGALRVFTQ